MPDILTTGGIAALFGGFTGFITNLYNKWRSDTEIDKMKKTVYSKLDDIERDLNVVHLDLAKNYITRKEVKDALQDIKHTMERIETKVDKR